ncbi:MAG: RluA family pseudouridine synthase [bacterium]|nr:RluA family pseudouridine synthase [bacterium]
MVHRLDRTTSGVMVIAKTQEAYAFLKEQFQNRTVEKRYDALVYGHPKEDFGTIEAEIGRTKKKPRKWIANFAHGKKRAAVTAWRVLGRYSDPETSEPVAQMEVSPKTGRTHQIRVHLKAMHHPIVCDHLYAPKKPCLFGLARPALHAHFLTLTLPNGERTTFEAPLPRDMKGALHTLETPTSK